jgi:23S rRNA pseudouridine1911/1915/1917 synthase
MTRKNFRFLAEVVPAGQRLDQFLAAQELLGWSRGRARQVVDLGGVHINGRRIRRCSEAVANGKIVEVFLDDGSTDPFILGADHILYQDRFLLAVNKPAGIETQPTPARYQGTLYAALLAYLHDPYRPLDRPALGMVQRLDRETSGVMVFSIHPRAHKGLTAAFTGRSVEKTYLALVAGRVGADEGEIHSCLARSRGGNRVRSVTRGGREAITRYRVLERLATATLLEVVILTGRSHQIRAHFAEAGHPLLGDQRYGAFGEGAPRQMLHAVRLVLNHPVTGDPLTLEAPLPADLATVLDRLRT